MCSLGIIPSLCALLHVSLLRRIVNLISVDWCSFLRIILSISLKVNSDTSKGYDIISGLLSYRWIAAYILFSFHVKEIITVKIYIPNIFSHLLLYIHIDTKKQRNLSMRKIMKAVILKYFILLPLSWWLDINK